MLELLFSVRDLIHILPAQKRKVLGNLQQCVWIAINRNKFREEFSSEKKKPRRIERKEFRAANTVEATIWP